MTPNRVQRRQRGRRGFSLIEVMISAGVLGIGLAGVIQLHVSSVRGLASGRSISLAGEIASQRVEFIGGRDIDVASLPTCPRGASGVVDCRANKGNFTATKTCSTWLAESDVPTPAGLEIPSEPNVGYRRDLVIEAHPDTLNHNGSFLAIVSVCWRDSSGNVQQIQSQRLLIPGI
jgi:prepilin-type N-terminal cleavage/methylation domain-containing protein